MHRLTNPTILILFSTEPVEFYIKNNTYPDTVIKAISELHRNELSIMNMVKEVPNLVVIENSNISNIYSDSDISICLSNK
jgi:hypothetical protein